MNYKKIYENFCNYCKTVPPVERLKRRNPYDFRLEEGVKIYLERHHIIPRHSGGSDEESNLVQLTPEEHYFAHLCRYKAYDERGDFLACRFIINGIRDSSLKYQIGDFESYSVSKLIARYKTHIIDFRKRHGWQTANGVKRISEARKNMIVAKNVKTGEIVGAIPRNDPRLLSGELVHHSTGMVSALCKETGENVYVTKEEYAKGKGIKYKPNQEQAGEKNGNYKGCTAEQRRIVFECVPLCCIDDTLVAKKLEKLVSKRLPFSISAAWIRQYFGSYSNLVREYNEKYGAELFSRNDCRKEKYTPLVYAAAIKIREEGRMITMKEIEETTGIKRAWIHNNVGSLRDILSNLDKNKEETK